MQIPQVEVKLKKLAHYDDKISLPSYKTEEAAGADIRACLGFGNKLVLKPNERVAIATGLAMEIPKGFEIQVRPRSGLSLNTSLSLLNSPGTIDSDYRGELKVIAGNWGDKDVVIFHGDRIAQLVLCPVIRADFKMTDKLNDSERGVNGFGSTGLA
jgi:dUTP pyrophosphatase